MIRKILNFQTQRISFSSLILAVSYLISAALGLLRDRLLAGRFGAGNELDVYYVAFTIPDLIALLLIFGAISAAVIPIFSSYWARSKQEAWQYLSLLLNVFLSFLIIVCVILIIFAPFLVSIVAPGFSAEKKMAAALLMRIMFLSPIILGTSNIISGVLQVFQRFLATALAPIMYNIGIIIGILFFTPVLGVVGLAWGVVLGGLLHLTIQLPALFNSGFNVKLAAANWNFSNMKHSGVVQTIKLMAPRSIGLAAGQLNIIVTTAIASTLATGSIAVFNLANNVSSLLNNVIAVSLSTAVFPAMTLAYAKKDYKQLSQKFSAVLRQIMFFAIPLSFLIFILRVQIVRVVLGVGKFGWLDTRLTAACLGIFSFSLLGQAIVLFLAKTFYASKNTKIPALISLATVIFNITASFFFVWLLNSNGLFYNLVNYLLKLDNLKDIRLIGLALAFSLTVIVESFMLLFLIYKKLKLFVLSEITNSLYKILIASLAMTVVAFLTRQSLVAYNIVNLQTFLGVFWQLVLSGLAGVACYIITSFFLNSPELKLIKGSFFRNNRQIA